MFKVHIGSISFTFGSTLSSSLLACSNFSRKPWVLGFNFFLLILKDFLYFFIEPLVQFDTQFFTFQDLVDGLKKKILISIACLRDVTKVVITCLSFVLAQVQFLIPIIIFFPKFRTNSLGINIQNKPKSKISLIIE